MNLNLKIKTKMALGKCKYFINFCNSYGNNCSFALLNNIRQIPIILCKAHYAKKGGDFCLFMRFTIQPF